MMLNVLITFALSLSVQFFLGCGKQLYIKADRDPEWSPLASEGIYVGSASEASVEEKKVRILIEGHLRDKGYFVANDFSEYLLTFSYNDDKGTSSGTLYFPNTTTTYGNVGGVPYSSSSTSTQALPYTSRYSFRKLYLSLYRTAEARAYANGEIRSITPVWEGFCSIDTDYYRKNESRVLSACLDAVGRNKEGDFYVR